MAGGTVAAFWAVSFLLVITPGADWAYAIAAGLRHRVVLPAVGGLLVGHLVATAVVAAGVGALVARSPLVLTVLTVVGATYLLWLGIGMLAHPAAPQADTEEPAGSWLRQAAKGAGISGLNPKVFCDRDRCGAAGRTADRLDADFTRKPRNGKKGSPLERGEQWQTRGNQKRQSSGSRRASGPVSSARA
jgi:LysE type translocator